MRRKPLARKARAALHILKKDGPVELGSQFLKRTRNKTNTNQKQKSSISVKVKRIDLVQTDLSKKPAKWAGTKSTSLTFNWVMPQPGRGSGGHTTIFRFMRYIEQAGHTCRIYLYADGGGGST